LEVPDPKMIFMEKEGFGPSDCCTSCTQAFWREGWAGRYEEGLSASSSWVEVGWQGLKEYILRCSTNSSGGKRHWQWKQRSSTVEL